MDLQNLKRLDKRQAAIIGLYTGIVCGSFADIQELAEQLLGRPIWTHQFADKALNKELKEAAKPYFLAICNEEK